MDPRLRGGNRIPENIDHSTLFLSETLTSSATANRVDRNRMTPDVGDRDDGACC